MQMEVFNAALKYMRNFVTFAAIQRFVLKRLGEVSLCYRLLARA
jgi:hypothetical protein